jgi:c(7)-type cytochrome triheme protein
MGGQKTEHIPRKEENMRGLLLFLTMAISVSLATTTFAVTSGKTVDYAGGAVGKVIFDGKAHADKGLKCADCHPKIFAMKKGMKITMAEMNEGKNCGACHNGEKAFKSADKANCGKCHKK